MPVRLHIQKSLSILLSVLGLCVFFTQAAQAHMIEAQHGAINIVDDGAYTVISFPYSAFDANHDSKNKAELMIAFNEKRNAIHQKILNGLRLLTENGETEIKGLRLIPDFEHGNSRQVVAIGKFPISSNSTDLRVSITIFGVEDNEKVYEITIKKPSVGFHKSFELSKDKPHSE